MASLAQKLNFAPTTNQEADPITIEMNAYLPDRPALANPGMTLAKNCYPQENGTYGPFRSQQVISQNAMDSICRGMRVATDEDGDGYLYTGDLSKLYQYAAETFEDVSRAAGYTLTTEQRWDFTIFQDNIISTNFNDPVQSRIIADPAATKFADLITSTNKPKAKFCAQLRDFLVLGNTQDDVDGVRPERIWWSAFGDSTDFDPDATTQSDFEDLKSGGSITGIVGGAEYGVIFQEGMIRRMVYVGTPVIFDIQPADRQRGCRVPTSIIPHGRLIFFYGDEGFMAFDGTTSQPIGAGSVDKTVERIFTQNEGYKVVSAKDPINKVAMWAFPEAGSATATRLFLYNWDAGTWGEAEVDAAELNITLSESTTVDSQTFNIDTDPLGETLVDSSIWRGGNILVSVANTANQLAVYNGPTLAGMFDSGERQLFAGQRSQVDNVRPLLDGDAKMRVIQRDNQSQTPQAIPQTVSEAVAEDKNGKCNFIGRIPVARYQRFRVETDAGQEWDNLQGVQVYAYPAGPYQGTG